MGPCLNSQDKFYAQVFIGFRKKGKASGCILELKLIETKLGLNKGMFV
jgi:hypothetical protein